MKSRSHRMDAWCFRPAILIPLVILFSMIDAALTLVLVGRGASEMNPVMACFLEAGPVEFLLVKLLLTSASLFVVFLNRDTYLFRTNIQVRALFPFFLMPFTLVVQWELYLILFSP